MAVTLSPCHCQGLQLLFFFELMILEVLSRGKATRSAGRNPAVRWRHLVHLF